LRGGREDEQARQSIVFLSIMIMRVVERSTCHSDHRFWIPAPQCSFSYPRLVSYDAQRALTCAVIRSTIFKYRYILCTFSSVESPFHSPINPGNSAHIGFLLVGPTERTEFFHSSELERITNLSYVENKWALGKEVINKEKPPAFYTPKKLESRVR